jgi:hypothetical protein
LISPSQKLSVSALPFEMAALRFPGVETLAGDITVRLVDSIAGLEFMLKTFNDSFYRSPAAGNTLAVDLEGIDLSATGTICILQIVTSDIPRVVYLLDVCELGAEGFDTAFDFGAAGGGAGAVVSSGLVGSAVRECQSLRPACNFETTPQRAPLLAGWWCTVNTHHLSIRRSAPS